jgi:flagellar assembly protein FliH
MATLEPHKRFEFDTVFDETGTVTHAPSRAKQHFTLDDVESARQQGYAEGERSAVAQSEARVAQAISEIADHTRSALSVLVQTVHNHRAGAAALALAAARQIADAALASFPEAVIREAVGTLAREIEHEPRLVIQGHPDLIERLETALSQAADLAGFSGRIVVRSDNSLPKAAFSLDWADGRATFDPEATATAVAQALETALAAEGLHAEPLLPFLEA